MEKNGGKNDDDDDHDHLMSQSAAGLGHDHLEDYDNDDQVTAAVAAADIGGGKTVKEEKVKGGQNSSSNLKPGAISVDGHGQGTAVAAAKSEVDPSNIRKLTDEPPQSSPADQDEEKEEEQQQHWEEEIAALPAPLPTTQLIRQQQQGGSINHPSNPGAYSAAPGTQPTRIAPSTLTTTEMADNTASAGHQHQQQQRQQQQQIQRQGSENLSVANMVFDDDINENLPHAQEYYDGGNNSNQKVGGEDKIPTCVKIGLFLGALVVLAVVLVVAFAVPNNSTNVEDDGTAPMTPLPTMSPSEAPSLSLEGRIKSFLTPDTLLAMEDPKSPQSRAYQWLLEDDMESLLSYSDSKIQQKLALATLYYATNGNNWLDNTNWLNHSVDECKWYNSPEFALKTFISRLFKGYLIGFLEEEPNNNITTCDEDGLYQHLWLDQNNLGGSIPDELYYLMPLTSLKTISFLQNRLVGTISTYVGQLKSLIGFGHAWIQKDAGRIPSELGLLTNLQVLILTDNNHVGSFPQELWEGLTNLDTLTLSRNHQLTGSAIPTQIGNFDKFRWMGTVGCKNLTGSIPTEIGLATSLDSLAVSENSITGSLPSELMQLTKLTALSFYENSMTGTLHSEIGQLSNLGLLSMRDNQLTGPMPSELGLLTNMAVTLNMRNNQFTGTIPTELGLLSGLLEIELRGNALTGKIPSEFGQLDGSMDQLTLASNFLTGTVPNELEALYPTLHTLALEDNPMLSGTMPEGVCKIINGTSCNRPGIIDPCEPPFGLSFDCTSSLCGCSSCPCGEAN